MLIKFFPNGKGGGAGPVEYLTARTVLAYDDNRDLIRDASGQPMTVTRDPLPEVVSGDPQGMIDLIDACPHKWTYRAGVVSFAREDAPTEAQQQEMIDRFEEIAFAGLDADRYACLWVRHTHEDRVELHFCTPRMELHSGRSFNIAPPGYERAFDSLRDLMNKTHGWADPMDAERAAKVKAVNEAPTRAQGREELHGWIRDQISVGLITDRAVMIETLRDAGFAIPRAGKNYITAQDPETGEKWRLKGEIFHEDWQADTKVEREASSGHGAAAQRERRLDGVSAEELQDRFEGHCRRRAAYNSGRYGRATSEVTSEVGDREPEALRPPDVVREMADIGDCDTHVGDDAWLRTDDPNLQDELASLGHREDQTGQLHIFDLGERDHDATPLHVGGRGARLHQDRGVSNGWSDSIRARIAELRGAVDASIGSISAGIEILRKRNADRTGWVARLHDRIGQITDLIGQSLERLDARSLGHRNDPIQAARQLETRPKGPSAARETLAEDIGEDVRALRH